MATATPLALVLMSELLLLLLLCASVISLLLKDVTIFVFSVAGNVAFSKVLLKGISDIPAGNCGAVGFLMREREKFVCFVGR